jgi:hypothetical protein
MGKNSEFFERVQGVPKNVILELAKNLKFSTGGLEWIDIPDISGIPVFV